METEKIYTLPDLPYSYKDLEPYMSEEQLTLHRQKHHQAYINNANAIFEKLEKSRKEGAELDIKATLRDLSFNVGGHILHSLFWKNMAKNKGKNNAPQGDLLKALNAEFGSFDRFKKEFGQIVLGVEGAGWAALVYEDKSKKLLLTMIEKHNNNIYPSQKILMLLDAWEHSYYLDYKNDKAKYAEAFWNIVDWEEVASRLEEAVK